MQGTLCRSVVISSSFKHSIGEQTVKSPAVDRIERSCFCLLDSLQLHLLRLQAGALAAPRPA